MRNWPEEWVPSSVPQARSIMILDQYKHVPLIVEANYKLIPVTLFDINDQGMNAFNDIMKFVKSYDSITKLKRTKSGGISTSIKNFLPPMYDVRQTNSVVEITIIIKEGMWRFQFRKDFKSNATTIGGTQATNIFKKKLKEISNINLEDYLINNGIEERLSVPKYIIKNNEAFCPTVMSVEDAPIWKNVHHIDFHSSFAAGLANTYPEFRPTLEFFYEKRKKYKIYKGLLNSLIGNLWSVSYKKCGYVKLAKAAITDNNNRVNNITEKLVENGRIPLAWNTDGVWYYGDIYHGEGEGKGLGQWENDHLNCIFRMKSKGSYEFIEDGVYHPVVRGVPDQKKINWEWGSIFSREAEPVMYAFNEERSIYKL